ncbi:MAG: PKD domain-containing protein [Myxococcota bacterium]
MRARLVLCGVVISACGVGQQEDPPRILDVQSNQEPVAVMEAPAEIAAGVEFSVDGNASFDIDGTVVEHSWNLGTGAESVTGPQATFRYTEQGLFTLELRVTDNGGKRGRARKRIKVLAPPDPNPPTVEPLLASVGQRTLAENDVVNSGETVDVVVQASDAESNVTSVDLTAEGALGAVPVNLVQASLSGNSGTARFSVVVPEAAGQLRLSGTAQDAYGNSSTPSTLTLRAVLAGSDTDGDGLPDGNDPLPDAFNGLQARVYQLESVPRDLLQRQKAEDVVETVRAGTPAFTANVTQGFLRSPPSSGAVNTLPGLEGAPTVATKFAVLYGGTLRTPPGATTVTVEVGADDIGVVFLGGEPRASADEEYARDFFRTDRIPAVSEPVSLTGTTTPVEILVANDDGPHAWEVKFTFSDGTETVLGPEQVGQAQFLAP